MTEKNKSLEGIFAEIENQVNQNPAPIKDFQAMYQFEITNQENSTQENSTYQLVFQEGKVTVMQNSEQQADCVLKMSSDSLEKFLSGKLQGTVAFMTGKLKINGDISKALKLESLLKEYDFG